MSEKDERPQQLEAYAKLDRLSAEQNRANGVGIIRNIHNADRIANIALAAILIVTIAVIVGAIISVVAPHTWDFL
jgi:hypothetical protein